MYGRLTSGREYPLPIVAPISIQTKFRRLSMDRKVKVCAVCGMIVLTLFYFIYCLPFNWGRTFISTKKKDALQAENGCPLTRPIQTGQGLKYRIGIITDLDENSKDSNAEFNWHSYLKRGTLLVGSDKTISVSWDESDVKLTSSLSQGGRGMELSELVCFDGEILSLDDRTGVIYRIIDRHVAPWVVMADGDGSEKKGFKGEWATVKDGQLYVGGLGKEWTTNTGEVLNFNPQYVKIIGPSGSVTHVNWVDNYKKLLAAAGINPPGYLIHESAMWSPLHKKWYFLPRRASKLSYDDKKDERRGTNMLISCTDNFAKCERTFIGPLNLTHGFSSFKFIPGTNEQHIIALKTEEVEGKINSYIMAFDVAGRILMREQTIPGSYKFEGIEFL